MMFLDRGLAAPITIGVVEADPAVRTLEGTPFERRGFEHEL